MIKGFLHIFSKNRSLWLIIIMVFLTVSFVQFPYMQNSTVTPKWILLSMLCFPLFFIKSQRLTKINISLIIWFIFILQYGLQCFRSYNFWDSLVYTIPLLIVPVFIYLLANKIENLTVFYKKIALISTIVCVPLVLFALLELLTLFVNGEYSHENTYAFKYAFGHRNSFSQFIVLLIPLIAIGYKNNKIQKALTILLISLIYIVAILLMNKTVLIILLGVYPTMFLLFYLSKLSKKIKIIGISSLAFILVLGLGVMASGKLKNTSYFGKVLTTDYGSGNERIRIWKNSYDIFKTQPIIGKGSGDWKIEILNTPLRFTQAEQSMVFYRRAHNDFIQIGVENGLIGLGLILLFFIVAITGLARSKIDSKLKFILISGVLGFLVIMNTSFPLEKIELLLLLFLFLLPLFIVPYNKSAPKFKLSSILILFNIVVFLGAIFWCIKEVKYFKNVSENNIGELSDLNLDVYSISPDVLPTYSIIATDYTIKNDYVNAIKDYEKALQHNPYHVHVLNGIGSSYYALGNNEKAKLYYQKALEVNPYFSETLLNHTALMFNDGNIDGALDELLKVVIGWEPTNYFEFMVIIAKAKCDWLIELHDEPNFKSFLNEIKNNDEVLYQIATNARKSGACYEDELRIYFSKI